MSGSLESCYSNYYSFEPHIFMDTPNSQQKPVVPMPQVDSALKQENLPTQRIKPLFRGMQIVWYVLAVLEILLALRFLLKLFAANPQAGFTQFIYVITGFFAAPFFIVFKVSQVQGSIFEWSTLLAMAVYLLIAFMIVKAIIMIKPVSTKEADMELNEQK